MLVISRNEKKIFMQIHDPANDNSAYYEGRERRDKCEISGKIRRKNVKFSPITKVRLTKEKEHEF